MAWVLLWGDYDNDGWQDLYLSNIPVGNKLLHNLGYSEELQEVVFEEVAAASGVGFYGISWGTNFFDADNDGHLDLYVNSLRLGTDTISNTLFFNDGEGQFFQEYAGFGSDTISSFCNAIGDFNHDGQPDIIVSGYENYNARLWSNEGTDNNWIKISLEGILSNRSGVGAKIEVFINDSYQMRYTDCGIAFMGQNSGTEIIGTGNSTTIDSIVDTWPTGHIDRLFNVDANQEIDLIEGSTTDGEIDVDPDVELTIVANQDIEVGREILSVFPNPATNSITFRSNNLQYDRYVILNESGSIILSGPITEKKQEIQTQNFAQGFYHLVIYNQKGDKLISKFMKS